MLIPFGVFSAGAGVSNSYELISTQILASATSSVSFSSIPTTYKHLQVRMNVNATNDINFRLNNDSGSTNYTYHLLYANIAGGNVAAAATGDVNRGYLGYVGAASSTVNAPFILDIVDSSSTSKYKTARSFAGTVPDSSSSRFVMLNSTVWKSTSAVTDISFLTTPSSNFGIGSRFSIYGIKG